MSGAKPRLLDLFCGAGGCAVGYSRAGFEVACGVDKEPQPNYPYPFVQADVFDLDEKWLRSFDFIHASPPCQAYTPLKARQNGKEYPDLLKPTRELLQRVGRPYAIENVPAAPMAHQVTLCGCMFDLRVYRARRFETSILVWQPEHKPHLRKTSTKKRRTDFAAGMNISVTGDVGSWVGEACMGIDWMTGQELSQAIPPAYTAWLGAQLRWAIGAAV